MTAHLWSVTLIYDALNVRQIRTAADMHAGLPIKKDCVSKPPVERQLGCADHCGKYIQGYSLQHRARFASIALYKQTSRQKTDLRHARLCAVSVDAAPGQALQLTLNNVSDGHALPWAVFALCNSRKHVACQSCSADGAAERDLRWVPTHQQERWQRALLRVLRGSRKR